MRSITNLKGDMKKKIKKYEKAVKGWEELLRKRLRLASEWESWAPKPLRGKKLLAYRKEQEKHRKQEERRRAKKITMTVGEFEDKLDEARNDY